MPNDINELDATDAGLKMVMGERFQDATEAKPATARKCKESTCTACPEKKAHKPARKVKDAEWEPVWEPVKERNWMDDLVDCVKVSAVYAGINLLLWYWMVAGLMAESVAMPSMIACALLMGLKVGKVAGRSGR